MLLPAPGLAVVAAPNPPASGTPNTSIGRSEAARSLHAGTTAWLIWQSRRRKALRRGSSLAPNGASRGHSASARDNSEALPPTAVVFTEVVRSLTKRSR